VRVHKAGALANQQFATAAGIELTFATSAIERHRGEFDASGLGRYARGPQLSARFWRIMRPLLRTPEEGAGTVVRLAVSRRAGTQTGRFCFDRDRRSRYLLSGRRSGACAVVRASGGVTSGSLTTFWWRLPGGPVAGSIGRRAIICGEKLPGQIR